MTSPNALRRFARSVAAPLAAAALLVAAEARAEDPPAAPQLPAGVVARVYGEDLTEDQLLDRLSRRHETSERGKQILEQIVDDQAVAMEAARRGVTVTDDEARAYADQQMAEVVKWKGKGATLEDVLAEAKTTREEFYRSAREYLLRDKMARTDLGTKAGEALPEHRMKLWVSSVRRRLGVKFEGLPDGVLAEIGGTAAVAAAPEGSPPVKVVQIDRRRFAKELTTRLPTEMVAGVRAELVVDAATRHAVKRAGIEVTDEDVDAQVTKLRERFEQNPRVKDSGVTFDQFLKQTFGIGEAELRKDATFRARVGLERMLSRDLTDAQVRKHWEENRAAYGDRALVRQVFVQAGEQGAKLESALPSFREASDLALRAKVAILEKTGALAGGAAKTPLPDAVTAVAKQFETDPDGKRQAGEPVAWTRENVAGEPALEAAVFDGELGRLAGPIRSQVGWHVFVVEERRPAPSWDEVKGQVREDLLRVAVRRFQLQLRADPNVVLAK